MGLLNSVKNFFVSPVNSSPSLAVIQERTNLKTVLPEKKFPADVGIEHPYDFGMLEKWYKDDPFVHGMVEKHVDFIMGGGFKIVSKSGDKRVEELFNEQARSFEMQTLLREWIKRSLIMGNGYIEIFYDKQGAPTDFNVLDGKHIYIRLKKKNNALTNDVEGYSQFVNFMVTPQPIILPEKSIAHLAINKVDDNPYGMGVVQPLTYALNKKAGLLQDMCTLMNKKAGMKPVMILGDRQLKIVPRASEVQDFGTRLEAETNLSGYVVGPYFDFKMIDYGDVGGVFQAPLDVIDRELVYGSQVPHVLMGVANVAEGLATAQGKAWLYRIRSLQEDIEKVIEKKIFAPMALANGFNPSDIEFEWGSLTPEEKRAELLSLQSLLTSAIYLSPDFTAQLEKRLRQLLDFDQEPEDSMEAPQPRVPPEGLERPPVQKEEKAEGDLKLFSTKREKYKIKDSHGEYEVEEVS